MTVWKPTRTGFARKDDQGTVINLLLTGQGEGFVPRPTFADGVRRSLRTRPTDGAAKAAVLKYAGTAYSQLPASEAPDSPGRNARPNQGGNSVNAPNAEELGAKIDRLEGVVSGLAAYIAGQAAVQAPAPTPEPVQAPAPSPQPVAVAVPSGNVWAAPGVTWGAFKAAKAAVRNRTYRYGGGWRTRKGYKLPRVEFKIEVDNQLREWGWKPFYAQVGML
jgi:hypothetical protein